VPNVLSRTGYGFPYPETPGSRLLAAARRAHTAFMAAPTPLPPRNAVSVDAAYVAAGPGASVESHPLGDDDAGAARGDPAAMLRLPCGVSLCMVRLPVWSPHLPSATIKPT
jgi:hypothetical protein